MKQPIKSGERYLDCANLGPAVCTEVYPVVLEGLRHKIKYWLAGSAHDWDVIGVYETQPTDGRFSNCSWKHCGCEKL